MWLDVLSNIFCLVRCQCCDVVRVARLHRDALPIELQAQGKRWHRYQQ